MSKNFLHRLAQIIPHNNHLYSGIPRCGKIYRLAQILLFLSVVICNDQTLAKESSSEFLDFYQQSMDREKRLLQQQKENRTKQEEFLLREMSGGVESQEDAIDKQKAPRSKEEETALQKIKRLKQQEEEELRNKEGLKATQEELARQQEQYKERINGIKKSAVQEKAITEAMLKKQKGDEAKIRKIEDMWQRARRYYGAAMYEEAIKDFEEIIKLEGNPRIKYTPFAKEYIERSKAKLIEQNKATLSADIDKSDDKMINRVLEQQIPPYIEPPARIEETGATPLIEPPLIRKKLKDKKISMDFDKVDLKSAMGFLSQESGVNFIASQKVLEIAPKVTVRFSDTPVDEVIKYVTKSLGLIYRIDDKVVWIAHPEEIAQESLETRVYYLSKGGGLFTEFTPISGGSVETGLGGSSAQISKITTIEDTLKEVIPWPSDSKLTYDKRICALIVRNTPQNLQMLEDILYNLDVTPYQILIEARFLEVNITDTEELGLEWKFNDDFPFKKQQAGGTQNFSHGVAKESGVDFSTFARAAEGLNLTYKGVLTDPQFSLVLHALEETKKAKTLSSPRITTLNNQMATIKVVDEWIYPTRYEYEVVQTDLDGDGKFTSGGETTYKNVPKDFLRRDVGILLKVIPSVGADRKTINLSLIPEVSEATADGFSYTGDIKLPKFTSRNLSTTVVVNSGDTVVLGGLIKESRTKTLTKVPILGDIPYIGNLFKKNSDSIERKNLLIFVSARVLSASGEEVVVAQK